MTLQAIKDFFNRCIGSETDDGKSHPYSRLDLASAALMIEVMNCDHDLDKREQEKFVSVLQSSYGIAESEIQTLVSLAESEAHGATSLYEFTRLINDGFGYDEKVLLVENMWRIAFSDDKLDKYEDHLIRKISDLIHVSHSDFIKTKLQVRGEVSQD